MTSKLQSIKVRLLLAFILVLSGLLFALALYLNSAVIAEKKQNLLLQTELQAEAFRSYLSTASDIQELFSQLSDQTLFTKHSNIYLYNAQNELAGSLVSMMTIAQPELSRVQQLRHSVYNQSGSAHFSVERDSAIYSTGIENSGLLVIVTSLREAQQQVRHFQVQLLWVMVSIVVILMMLFTAILWRELKQIDTLSTDLQDIAKGKSEQLKGEYAIEFHAMQDSLNNLLNAERVQRERYRNTLADLAHSLKTPLAVLQGAASEQLDFSTYMSVASEQVRRMDQIIQYQLTRAVKSNADGTMANAVLVTPIIERIISALGKVYREKEVNVILNLARKIELNADERDLMEMLGNMLENAFKYCRAEVAVSMYADEKFVYIDIEDDGAGVSEDMR
ncbi:MAG: hypothetical protein ACPG4U_06205, partial [Pseudomonadales bacterium]